MKDSEASASAARRLRFALVVLISQLLLIALAFAWGVHMALIAANGSVYFVEKNTFVLWLEIALTLAICLFGVTVFVMQLRRLRERRSSDSLRGGAAGGADSVTPEQK